MWTDILANGNTRLHEAVLTNMMGIIPPEEFTEDNLLLVGNQRQTLMQIICKTGQANLLPKSAFSVSTLINGRYDTSTIKKRISTPLHMLALQGKLTLIPEDIPRDANGYSIVYYLFQYNKQDERPIDYSINIHSSWWKEYILDKDQYGSSGLTLLQYCAKTTPSIFRSLPQDIIDNNWEAPNTKGQNLLHICAEQGGENHERLPQASEYSEEAVTAENLLKQDHYGKTPLFYFFNHPITNRYSRSKQSPTFADRIRPFVTTDSIKKISTTPDKHLMDIISNDIPDFFGIKEVMALEAIRLGLENPEWLTAEILTQASEIIDLTTYNEEWKFLLPKDGPTKKLWLTNKNLLTLENLEIAEKEYIKTNSPLLTLDQAIFDLLPKGFITPERLSEIYDQRPVIHYIYDYDRLGFLIQNRMFQKELCYIPDENGNTLFHLTNTEKLPIKYWGLQALELTNNKGITVLETLEPKEAMKFCGQPITSSTVAKMPAKWQRRHRIVKEEKRISKKKLKAKQRAQRRLKHRSARIFAYST